MPNPYPAESADSHEGFNKQMAEGTGSFEVFWSTGSDEESGDPDGLAKEPGWYWWACFPGCLPDGDPVGPFDTSQEAHDDAMGE